MAAATSSFEVGRVMSAGWWLMSPFQSSSARAWVKPASVGDSTSPAKDERREVIALSSRVMATPQGSGAAMPRRGGGDSAR
jgi:hypothetical protein